jgi:hypothetical protein
MPREDIRRCQSVSERLFGACLDLVRSSNLRHVACWGVLLVCRSSCLPNHTCLRPALEKRDRCPSGETNVKLRGEEVCENESNAEGDDNSVVLLMLLSTARSIRND